MRSNARERQEIVDYVSSQRDGEIVEVLEKVYFERVAGQKHDTWNVHTNDGRYWVITNPINLYSQKDFPHMDVAFTFHIGLTVRVLEHSSYAPEPERVIRFANALRRLEQAEYALGKAEEADEFQAIGALCRECLLAFVKEAATMVGAPAEGEPLKAADFKGWSEHIANTIAAGNSNERRRSFLKALATATWQYIQSVVHEANATRFDAKLAVEATGWLVSAFANTLLRFEHGHPERCPQCASYQLSTVYLSEDEASNEKLHFVACGVCGWESDYTVATYGEKPRAKRTRKVNRGDTNKCVFVEVQLRGPEPPKPSITKYSK